MYIILHLIEKRKNARAKFVVVLCLQPFDEVDVVVATFILLAFKYRPTQRKIAITNIHR